MEKIIKPLNYISLKQKRLFFNFLYSLRSPCYNKIAERYKKNCQKNRYYGSDSAIQRLKNEYLKLYPFRIIFHSFDWAQTPEGFAFWKNVDQEWKRYVSHNQRIFYRYR